MLTAQDIRDWLTKEARVDVSKLTDDSPLFSSGALDSFTMVELVALVEERTGRSIPPLEVTHENIDTINRVVAWAAGAGAGT